MEGSTKQFQTLREAFQRRQISLKITTDRRSRTRSPIREQIVATTKLGAESAHAITARLFELKKQQANDVLKAQFAALDAEQAAARDNWSLILKLQPDAVEMASAYYGEDSAQYQVELRSAPSSPSNSRISFASRNAESISTTAARWRRSEKSIALDEASFRRTSACSTASGLLAVERQIQDQAYLAERARLQDFFGTWKTRASTTSRSSTGRSNCWIARTTRIFPQRAGRRACGAQFVARDRRSGSHSALQQMTQGFQQGTQTWREMIRRSLASIELSFIQSRIRIELDWLAGMAAMKLGAADLFNTSLLGKAFGGGAGAAAKAVVGRPAAAVKARRCSSSRPRSPARRLRRWRTPAGYSADRPSDLFDRAGPRPHDRDDRRDRRGAANTTATVGLVPAMGLLEGGLAANTIALGTLTTALAANTGTNLIPFASGAWEIPGDTRGHGAPGRDDRPGRSGGDHPQQQDLRGDARFHPLIRHGLRHRAVDDAQPQCGRYLHAVGAVGSGWRRRFEGGVSAGARGEHGTVRATRHDPFERRHSAGRYRPVGSSHPEHAAQGAPRLHQDAGATPMSARAALSAAERERQGRAARSHSSVRAPIRTDYGGAANRDPSCRHPERRRSRIRLHAAPHVASASRRGSGSLTSRGPRPRGRAGGADRQRPFAAHRSPGGSPGAGD